MATYQGNFLVVTRDRGGRVSTQQIRANSPHEARAQVVAQGHAVLSCEQTKSRWAVWTRHSGSSEPSSFVHFKPLDNASFSQDFAALIDAGLSIAEALETLALKETDAARRDVLVQIRRSVAEGCTLSAAMQSTGAFPDLLIATTEASERTGDLGAGLSRYASHQREMQALRDKLIGASVYPLVLLVVGGLVVMFLMGVVIPRFSGLMEGTKAELPLLSAGLMAWGRTVAANPSVLFVFFGAVLLAGAAVVMHFRRYGIRSRWLQAVPYIATVVREFQHLQLYRTSAILVSRGIVIHRALEHGQRLLNEDDRQRLVSSIALMRQGQSLSAAMGATGLSDAVASSMLKVGERTGSMSDMLERIARFYERRLQRSIDIATRVIEPALMIVIGTVIGAIVVLMYLPIFDLASSIS